MQSWVCLYWKHTFFIKQWHPGIDILVNNAAIQYNYYFAEEQNLTRKIDDEISTNLAAPVKLTFLLLPLLLKNENSAVINVSSGLFIAPKKSASVYCATKSAIHSFSRTLRYQLENTGTKVFEIIPALIDTPMTEGRGKSKLTPEQLVEEFIRDLKSDQFESYIGKAKLLKLINRISPGLAYKIRKNGLRERILIYSRMIADQKLKAFVPTTKPGEAKSFYQDILGLKLLSEDNFALEFDANGTLLRVTTVQDLTPQPFTILGWNLDDIVSAIKQLNSRDVFCEQYDFLEQDESGIWISPNGSKVAWFKDPDGNVLSLTELPGYF